MALIQIDNDTQRAMPAERRRGLIANIDGPIDCGTDYYQTPLESRLVDKGTLILDLVFGFDPKSPTAIVTLVDGFDASSRFGLSLQTNGQLFFYFGNQTTATADGSWSAGLSAGSRAQFAMVFSDSNTMAVYLNGAEIRSPLGKPAVSFSDFVVTIGANYLGAQIADCTVNSVKVFDVALSEAEIADYANNSTFNYLNRQPNLIVPMTMDKHLGNTLLDNQLESWNIRGPIKQANRGYYFDGAFDRIASGSKTNLPTDACSFIALVEPQYDVAADSYTWVLGNQSSNASNGVMLFSKGSDGYGWVFSVNEHSGTDSGSAAARSGNAVIPDGPAVLVGVYDKTEERIEIWINGENQSNTVVKTGPWEDINNVTDKYVIGQIFDVGTVYSFEGIIGFCAVLPFALRPLQIKDISALLKRTRQEV